MLMLMMVRPESRGFLIHRYRLSLVYLFHPRMNGLLGRIDSIV
jgi:hypothetical protein